MAAVASNPKFAKKAGVPQSVGAEFLKADKGRKFKEGGEMKESKKMVGKELAFLKAKNAPKSMIKHEESEMKGMKKMAMGGSAGTGITKAKMGTVKTAAPSRDGLATKGKTKGTMVKMAASKPLGMNRGGKTC
jgi:hypothetical protein